MAQQPRTFTQLVRPLRACRVWSLHTTLVLLRDDPSDPPADATPAYRQPHGCVRDLLRFLRNGFGLLPRDGLGVPVTREEAAARARRAGFGPPSSERPAVPQHRAGS